MCGIKLLLVDLIMISSGLLPGCDGQDVRLTPNVALTGVATQSETLIKSAYAASPLVASYAIDGNFDTRLTESHGACAIVQNNPPVWWQVDLLEVYEITKVAITSRSQHNRSQLKSFYIDVSNNSDGSSAQQCAHETETFADSETRVYTCPCGMFGRYVRIRYPVNLRSYLQLCEVQVQAGGFCPEPEEMDNAERSVPATNYEVGTNITYTCDQCYTGGGTSTCLQCNREWSPVKECRVKHCSDLGPIQNGQKEGRGPFTCISTVTYTCNQGYWLLGAKTLKCGTDGQWNYGKPSCIDKSQGCGEPPRVDNAQRFGSLTDIMYHCDECYTGGARATCRDGQWTHDGSCDMISCDKIPDVSNGTRTPTEDIVKCGTKMTYACNEGLPVEGDTVLECGDNGKLKGVLPVCKTSGGPGTQIANKEISDEETGNNNDPLAIALIAVGSVVVTVLITLAAVYLCRRKGMYPCASAVASTSNSRAVQDYEQPYNNYDQPNENYDQPNEGYVQLNMTPQIPNVNDQYAELNDPEFAGYMKPI